ncbi:hypothetical protein VTJ04DRAFT_572 [Mycothermus thermophilus]|uniref:uncharacterized protein n=1 Tax=Humicola insolens TaxID=85995 RepID=UPI003743649C
MNFYAASNMPVYRVDRDTRPPKASKSGPKPGKKSRFLGLQGPQRVAAPPPVRPVMSSSTVPHDASSIDGLLDPAVAGPPSPESIRELNQQMRAASGLDTHNNQPVTSSGSSLKSLTSDRRPSWDFTMENISISRKSSGRSSSSVPFRDRPDSVQIFGKSIFGRKGKGRRDSSIPSSSSSLYSTDVANDPGAATTSAPSNRDSTLPALFGLRRPRQDSETRRPNISEPYNFRHLDAQTPNFLTGRRPSRQEDFMPGRRPSRQEDMHFADFSSDSLPLQGEVAASSELQPTAAPQPRVLKKNPSASRRLLKRSQSQEHMSMGIPPPRPPRSPIDMSFTGAPMVPPRGSSRSSARHERFDSIDESQTNVDAPSPPATSYGLAQPPDMDAIPEHGPARDDENWPLPSSGSATASASEQTLPHVAEEEEEEEEEEIFGVTREQRISIASNSSLRGSQSVPMLRSASRRMSDGSDTLGRFDLFAMQRELREALNEGENVLPREAWEEDIDYCYDHAAEADCEYEWDRASFELVRDAETTAPSDDQFVNDFSSSEASPTMLTPAQFDLPALSPVSQASTATPQEAITPTGVVNPKAANFSLPRAESKKQPDFLHVRRPSDLKSFRESQTFTLSPSLLIPTDYHQQMLACQAERQESSDFAFRHDTHFGEPTLNMDPVALLNRYRSSASTTGTFESTSSAFDNNKHHSTASSSTDYTRMTASVSSLDGVEPCPPVGTTAAASPAPVTTPATEALQQFPPFEAIPESEAVGVAIGGVERQPSAGSSTRRPSRPPHFRSRGSESNLARLTGMDEVGPLKTTATAAKSSSAAATIMKRGRARTTSLSTPPPPNQYALFPSVQLTGNRI